MKITRITAAYFPDNIGTAVNSRNIIRRLAQRHECRVITFFPRSDMYMEGMPAVRRIELIDGVEVTRIWPFQRVVRGRLSAVLDIVQIILHVIRRKADVLHLHGNSYAIMVGGMIAAKLKGIHYVVTIAGGEIRQAQSRGGKFPGLFQAVLNRASRIVAIGEYLKRKAIEAGAEASKTVSILNGIDLEKYDVDAASIRKMRGKIFGDYETLLVLVGGMTSDIKGHDHALEVLAEVVKDFPRTCLLFAGDGTMRGDFESLARKLGVSRNVRFLGWVDNERICRLLLMTDLYLMCSRSEGLPTVVMEAMAAALPVVAFANGGAECLVREGETGFLVEQNKLKIQNAAEKIKLLISDKAKRLAFGEAARKIAREEFVWDKIIGQYEEIYSAVVKGEA